MSLSLLTLPVGDLLDSYDGDSREYAFEGELPPGYYDDLEFLSPLVFRIRLVASSRGIDAVIESLSARVRYEGRDRDAAVSDVVRIFARHFDPLGPDDVKQIDPKHKTIDLSDVVREEILIALIEL